MLSRRVLHCAVSQRAFRHKRLQRACWKFTGQVVCRLRSSVWWGLLYFSGSIASFAGLAVQARAAAPTDGAVHHTGLLGSGVHFYEVQLFERREGQRFVLTNWSRCLWLTGVTDAVKSCS